MEMTLEMLKARLAINEDNLDKELIEQPNLFYYVGKFCAAAIFERDKKDNEIDTFQAKLDRDIRNNAISNSERITETQIKSTILRNEPYLRHLSEMNELKRMVNEWTALRDAYQQRSYVLLKMVDLYVSGYYGQVTGRTERNDAIERRSNERRNYSRSD